jgi:hypothetical protein
MVQNCPSPNFSQDQNADATSANSISEWIAALSPLDSKYDESAALLADRLGEIRYHTRLKPGTGAHPLRESAEYASALLETGEDWRIRRAADILHAVLDLQDSDESSRTYGIWPWFLEEPLVMMAPPDWNWADFLGTQLAQILWRNGAHLDAALRGRLESALRHAARSIIRRDVTMRYTNIAIMGTYVTVMAGTILDEAEILEYGRNRLRRLHAFTEEWGGFPEYNSPNYTIVALAELTRMLRDFFREDDRRIVQGLHDRAWREIAVHWHVFSGQWSGPHSRSYQTILSPALLGFIDRGLRPSLSLQGTHPPALQDILLPVRCPDAFLPYFSGGQSERTHRQRALEGEPSLEGVSHLAEKFALSSVERGTFWNQARALTAYSRNAEGPTAWHVRFLRDGYDYSSANLISSQSGESVLGAICFAKDGGNVHCSLDRLEDARVEASDWRLRFQCHGRVKLPEIPGGFSTEQILNFELADDVVLSVRIPWLRFGDFHPHWELASDDAGVDLVLYRGPERPFVFDSAFPCAMGLAVTINGAAQLETVQAGLRDERLLLDWTLSPGAILRTGASLMASGEAEITDFARDVKTKK